MVPEGNWSIRWLNIAESKWEEDNPRQNSTSVKLQTPGEGYCLALISRVE
jgi:hypothetical protein